VHASALLCGCSSIYLFWRRYYADGIEDFVPKVVKEESENEGRNKLKELEEFVTEHIIADLSGGFIASQEIKEVFLIYAKFDTSVVNKTEMEMFTLIKKLLDPPKTEKDGGLRSILVPAPKNHAALFPGREKVSKVNGYKGIAWRPGSVGVVVNALRRTYCLHKLQLILEVEVDALQRAEPADA